MFKYIFIILLLTGIAVWYEANLLKGIGKNISNITAAAAPDNSIVVSMQIEIDNPSDIEILVQSLSGTILIGTINAANFSITPAQLIPAKGSVIIPASVTIDKSIISFNTLLTLISSPITINITVSGKVLFIPINNYTFSVVTSLQEILKGSS